MIWNQPNAAVMKRAGEPIGKNRFDKVRGLRSLTGRASFLTPWTSAPPALSSARARSPKRA
jgi:hypothetical protein